MPSTDDTNRRDHHGDVAVAAAAYDYDGDVMEVMVAMTIIMWRTLMMTLFDG